MCIHQLRDLNNWTKCSKATYAAGVYEMYYSVHITTEQIRYFLRTVLENRHLASLIQEMRFSFQEYLDDPIPNYRSPGIHELALPTDLCTTFMTAAGQTGYDWQESGLNALKTGSTDAEATLLLQILPSIETLVLDFPKFDWDDDEDYLRESSQGLFRHPYLRAHLNERNQRVVREAGEDEYRALVPLREIRLTRPYDVPFAYNASYPPNAFWELNELSGIFWQNYLERLSIDRCISGTERSEQPDMPKNISTVARTSELEEVMITSSCLEPKALELIFSLPRALKRFKYEIAENEHLKHLTGQQDIDHMTRYVSPKQLFSGLIRQKSAPNSLELMTLNAEWNGIEELYWLADVYARDPALEEMAKIFQPMDLRDFEALTCVSISAADLLGIEIFYDCTKYGPFIDVLPPNLERLQLWNPCEVEVDGVVQSWSGHIVDLLNNKKRFKSLKHVGLLVDSDSSLPGEEVHSLAREYGVELVIQKGRYGLGGGISEDY